MEELAGAKNEGVDVEDGGESEKMDIAWDEEG